MKKKIYFFVLLVLVVACKKPYNPTVISSPNSYLIVEGVINVNDVTTIKLSRTVNLTSTTTTNPVLNATLSVENDANFSVGLNEVGNGAYSLSGIPLDNSRKYRLRIKTADNQEYLSDFEPAKLTPPVDSVGFAITGNGIQIYANTHDAANNTRYYRFDYNETWAFHSNYNSAYVSNDSIIVPRTPAQDVYHCYANNTSSTIILASSAKLTQDVIFQTPITAIVSTSEKIETKYSILLREYALSADAFKFWTSLKKNTEQLGSIFDAQPSEISGNIHNVNNPKEPVVGYVSVGTVQSKRVFISNSQLPAEWRPTYPFNCGLDTVLYKDKITKTNQVAARLIPPPHLEIPVSAIYGPGSPSPIGFLSSDQNCADCTIRGYSQPPPFWQ